MDEGLWNPETGDYSPYPDGWTNPGTTADSGWSATLQGAFSVLTKTAAQALLVQQNQNGQKYIEGQRLIAMQQSAGGIPPLLLLVGAGVLLFALVKG